MEHKNYKYEIIEFLLRKKGYVRELAKIIGISHMTISRKMKELLKENVVDFSREGKNKVYFLKKTIEAKTYAYITENYKLLKLIEKYPDLRRILEKIQKDKRINMAIMFGSYAKGKAKERSDIDIFIETKNQKIKEEIQDIDSRVSVKIGEYKKGDLFKEIDKNHVIIKGVKEYYEKNGFFE